jgi:hypothetical protein
LSKIAGWTFDLLKKREKGFVGDGELSAAATVALKKSRPFYAQTQSLYIPIKNQFYHATQAIK